MRRPIYLEATLARLPPSLIRKPERTLRELAVGETAFAPAAAMRVTSTHDCYLRPTAKAEPEKSIFNVLRVTRKSDGYHVAVLSSAVNWDADATGVPGDLPVNSVVEDFDPEVDITGRGRK